MSHADANGSYHSGLEKKALWPCCLASEYILKADKKRVLPITQVGQQVGW